MILTIRFRGALEPVPGDGITLILRSDPTTGQGRGVANEWNTGGADYAEYYEFDSDSTKIE